MWSVLEINYGTGFSLISFLFLPYCVCFGVLKAQTMFAMMKTGKMERFMKDLEILGLLVACVSFVSINLYLFNMNYYSSHMTWTIVEQTMHFS